MSNFKKNVFRRLPTFAIVTLGVVYSFGDEVHLKNGLVLEGKAVYVQALDGSGNRNAGEIAVYPILMTDEGYKRCFVPRRQRVQIIPQAELSKYDKFKIPQRTLGRSKMLARVGVFVNATQFTKFGRRTVTVKTPNGPRAIIQGVTDITPRQITVIGLKEHWKYGIATTSIEFPILDAMIRNVTDQQNPEDRMMIARFYAQAGMYRHSERELESIQKDFADYAERVGVKLGEVRQLMCQQLLVELQRRKLAGQHALVYRASKRFPVQKASATVRRDVRATISDYDQARDNGELVLALLGDLQAEIKDQDQLKSLAPLRSTVTEELNYETLGRLDAFLNLADDKTLTAQEKLSLAYSGWVLGSANAVTNLEVALRLWDARVVVMDFLRTDDFNQRKVKLIGLQRLEGVSATTIQQMIPLLPPAIETPNLRVGSAFPVTVTSDKSNNDGKAATSDVRYSVLLPTGYNHHHSYPMIVALHSARRTAEKELSWWGGTAVRPLQSQRRGYIVIAPEYTRDKQALYDYSARTHRIVIESIRNARKRFNVNSDRIYLAGHGMGGDAAFDIGMSHPDIFAGVIPITGVSDGICKYYYKNAKALPWYVVVGELDRDTLARNMRDISRMLRLGFNIMYVEYEGRGYETYYEEIHRLFDWMDQHQRPKPPREIEVDIVRSSDNRFYWVKLDGLPDTLSLDGPPNNRKVRVKKMLLNARVNVGNAVNVRSGAEKTTIWLSPEFVDFDRRVRIEIKGRQRFNDFLRPDLQAMLEDLRNRGDRQRLFWVKMEFN